MVIVAPESIVTEKVEAEDSERKFQANVAPSVDGSAVFACA